VTILLDENFALALLRSLLADGENAEHIITLGLRGVSDARIRERLTDPEVLFLTRDDDSCSRSLRMR
jgi:predicted nuclease of predicted toxin-antitoxin system